MNLRSTLLLLLLSTIILLPLSAQVPAPDNPWGGLTFDENFVKGGNIVSISVSEYATKPSIRAKLDQVINMTFDQQGRLQERVELGETADDTASLLTNHYHVNGVLGWTEKEDYRFDRTFKTGYRFTADHSPYQEKSYEILPNAHRLLLESRQYVYADEAEQMLRSIRTLENGQLVEVHTFDYDQQGRIVAEMVEDSRGEIIKTTRYEFDQQDRIAAVYIEELGQVTARYLYQYNELGQPIETEWYMAQTLKGIARYEYDDQGRVSNLSRTENPGTRDEETRFSVYQYKTWEEIASSEIVATN